MRNNSRPTITRIIRCVGCGKIRVSKSSAGGGGLPGFFCKKCHDINRGQVLTKIYKIFSKYNFPLWIYSTVKTDYQHASKRKVKWKVYK